MIYGLHLLKRLLFVVLILSIAYVVSDSIFFGKRGIGGGAVSESPVNSGMSFNARNLPPEDYTGFLKEIEKRKIFFTPRIQKSPVSSKKAKVDLAKVTEGLRLVGVILEDNKKVIIEDKKNGKTFYLKEGEKFMSDFQVEKIGDDSVVLSCEGEEFELYL